LCNGASFRFGQRSRQQLPGTAPALALELATRTKTVKAVISVDRDGNAAIKGLILNGTRHDETLF